MLPAGTTADRISELFGAIGVTNRKAPAFLRGLFQFVASLVELEGLEPSTSCLQSTRISGLSLTGSRCGYRRSFVALIVFHERYARPHIGLGCIPASTAGRPKKVTSGDINVNSISNHFFLTEKGQLIIRIQYS